MSKPAMKRRSNEMRSIRTELEQGADFAEVADRRSDCPGRGGDRIFPPRPDGDRI